MNRLRTAKFTAPAAVLLLAVSATPSFAVRPERDPSAELSKNQAGAARRPERSADQAAAARDALRAGLRVRWDDEQGAPSRVRGEGIGRGAGLSKGGGDKVAAVAGDEGKALSALAGVGRLFGFRDVVGEFKSRSSRRDELGFRHVRMAQRHEGLRVVGGELIVHFDAGGAAYEVNGRYVTGIDVRGGVRLTPEDAVRAARADRRRLGAKPAGSAGNPELVVFAVGQAPALAYELLLAADSPDGVGAWRYWVDARSGDVLLGYLDMRTVAAPTADGAHVSVRGSMLAGEGGGVTNFTGWHENRGSYYLHSTQRWWQVYNIASAGTYPDKGTYANRATSDWGTSDRAEVSLAHAFEKVQWYYFSTFGLRSFDGAGGMARANVHYGNKYVNAFWDSPSQQFYFGDGNGNTANSLAVLDISGHEFGHAVGEYTANLVYAGESGALDESFADISGACVEFSAERDGRSAYPSRIAGRADWLIGEDCWLTSTALRDMRSPTNTATVGSGNEQPSRYGGRYWYSGTGDGGGVHYNSGVQNFFFYLLAEGGSGVNDGIPYSLTGIGVSSAERVAYRALTVYCTSSTGYRSVRDAWMSAAEDLNPDWVAAVDLAWNAVGLGDMAVTPGRGFSVSGPVGGPFAPSARTYTLTNSGVVSLTWSATHAQAWLDVAPTGGTLAGGATANVLVALNAGANALGQGLYSDSVVFSNAASGGKASLAVALRAGVRDSVTELFDARDGDLHGYMLTFRPDAVTGSYTAMAEPVSSYPTDPSGGVSLGLGDDSSVQVVLSGGKQVRLFGVEYDRFHVGSNGYITFGAGDSDTSETLADHFDLPRISALFDDLNPAGLSGSGVSWKTCSDRVAVTYDNVPEYLSSLPNKIQVEMFFDGTIRIAYPLLNAADGLAGLSPGGGVPAGFAESDLNSYGKPPVLRVTPPSIDFGVVLAGTVREGEFTVANAGEVALEGTTSVTGAFSVVAGAAYRVVPGATHTVRVQYNPASGGLSSNNVAFSDGGGAARAVTGRAIGNGDGDSDGDGMTDWEEYIAGTSSVSADEDFRIEEARNAGGALVIRWNSVTGRWYTVSAVTNLTTTWADVYGAAGTGAEMSYTNAPSGSALDFLRVRVRLGP